MCVFLFLISFSQVDTLLLLFYINDYNLFFYSFHHKCLLDHRCNHGGSSSDGQKRKMMKV
jgi:hypothetical protein